MNATITQDMSLFSLISEASIPVQLVMLILLLASFLSWWFIFRKLFAIREETKLSDEFEAVFWKGADLNELYQGVVNARYTAGSMERIFESGFREFIKHNRTSGMDIGAVMDGTRRAMRATYQREMDRLESHLAFLATVGSVSPYIGLFGTVWGIMTSFIGLAGSKGVPSLQVVAPGIAEALIATAIGLAAAIPAAVAYNYFISKVRKIDVEMDNFASEFLNVVERYLKQG